ncbi:MAG TPA: hypothetical protein PL107_10405 [Candidatus Marinimicrobia bacterium]|jgi:hypothetical protein|nr:hypothetical protein [Candidatus Neomarinimicrobiota bacterium]NLA23317.1 hypothetical protein [Candidatus Neomarinimicrobiota bacterium]HNZ37759.1 hypothetical protein [Candidatus Neomarinimicrobiota bacterium]HOV24656.1 hypothetical protein [Candidatus Neomarinimicrobiota bacterium]HRD19295.1 hypothetical protein [Candidatus Neomarinimicrobiota bacterium]
MPKKLSNKRLLELRTECEHLLERLGYIVVYGLGNFKEGACLVQSEKKIVINQYTPLDLQVDFLLKILKSQDLSGVFILPALRDLLEQDK